MTTTRRDVAGELIARLSARNTQLHRLANYARGLLDGLPTAVLEQLALEPSEAPGDSPTGRLAELFPMFSVTAKGGTR